MQTLEAITKRTSIRSFSQKNISRDIIEDILNCGRLAPSAKNRQPWFLVIVQNKIKDKIADMMIEYTINSDDTKERKKIGFNSSVYPTAKVIKEAPVLVLVFREKDNNWIVGDNLSIGACVENMCLRATDLDLGTLWIRDIVYVAEDVANMLGYQDLELNCALAIGYSNQPYKKQVRKKLEDIVKWYE